MRDGIAGGDLGGLACAKSLVDAGHQVDVLFWRDELRLQDPEGPEAVYGINPLRAPLKTTLKALGQNDFLSPLDKLALFPVSIPGLKGFETLQKEFDGRTVSQWPQERKGTAAVMERLLRPFCRAIQFTDATIFPRSTSGVDSPQRRWPAKRAGRSLPRPARTNGSTWYIGR